MKKYILLLFLALFLGTSEAYCQTVLDLHTGKISSKTKNDYDYQAREQWQMKEDSIAYIDCITRAFNYLHTDSLSEAQTLFEKALKLRPDAPGNNVLRHNIGRIFMARAQWKDAISLFSRILEEQPGNADVREDRATCYMQAENLSKALEDYDNLLLVHPEKESYHLMRAIILSHLGKPYDALDEIDNLLELNSKNADAYLVRAEIYLDLGNKGYARRDLDKAVSLGIPKDDMADLYNKITE